MFNYLKFTFSTYLQFSTFQTCSFYSTMAYEEYVNGITKAPFKSKTMIIDLNDLNNFNTNLNNNSLTLKYKPAAFKSLMESCRTQIPLYATPNQWRGLVVVKIETNDDKDEDNKILCILGPYNPITKFSIQMLQCFYLKIDVY